MRLKDRLAYFLGRRFGLYIKRSTTLRVMDKTYRVVGAAERQADYDEAWLLALAQHADRIFDIGCNIGRASLVMSYSDQVEQMLLADANPEALAIAAENMIHNGLSHKARFVCAFVSDQPGQMAILHTVGHGAAGSMYSGHAKSASQLGTQITVPTTTLDELVEMCGYLPDLVKIDVEGAELLVLKGAACLAQRGMTRFCVEMHSNPALPMKQNAANLIAWCQANAYSAWYLKTKIRLEAPEQIADRGRCHVLLLPKDQLFPAYLLGIEQGAPIDLVSDADESR